MTNFRLERLSLTNEGPGFVSKPVTFLASHILYLISSIAVSLLWAIKMHFICYW